MKKLLKRLEGELGHATHPFNTGAYYKGYAQALKVAIRWVKEMIEEGKDD